MSSRVLLFLRGTQLPGRNGREDVDPFPWSGLLSSRVHRTVSRMTPMRLCGRSASTRRDLLSARGLPAGAKVLRSPQLWRCSRPGCLRKGSVRALDVLGCNGAIICSRKLALVMASSMCSSSDFKTDLMFSTSSWMSGVMVQEDCSRNLATSSLVSR